ncbi:molybdate ABC transporter substrate-binding protein [Anaerovorax odorimutans]|uniref:molybdate ABC transporter substrate-binding protein n=1 Tax=Anaerovorax odorimutans TaxID=109327 RepID=UPI000425504C|nr:molybdate ABC transporter substrate-binding protein [Anaerovorax odorimutans]
MFNKKILAILLVLCLCIGLFAGCGNSEKNTDSDSNSDTTAQSLDGESLFIYCGAGMTKPFTEIVDLFKEKTGADATVSFGNLAQISSQINTSQEGDLFIAGDQDDLATFDEGIITDTKPLVKHIPVLVIQKGNPKNISKIKDLANSDIRLVLGDNQSTPIGKIADKVLKNQEIFDKVNIVSRATTAPEIANVLSMGECDAAIVWKENANNDGVEIVDTDELDGFIKTIPAASISYSKNEKARKAFLEFLDTDEVIAIWQKYGYEQVESDKE